MEGHGGSGRLKEAFEIEQPSRGLPSQGRASWAEVSRRSIEDGINLAQNTRFGKDLMNVRGCFCFWSAVVAILALLTMFTFWDRRDTSPKIVEEEFFREDHGFDIAAMSIADKLGYTLKVCEGSEYCVKRLGLYARLYQLSSRSLDLKIAQDQSSATSLVSLNLPRTPTLDRAVQMDGFSSQDEGTFSGLVVKRLSEVVELSEYGATRARPSLIQAIDVAADLVVALNTLHTKVKDHAILHCTLLPKNVFVKESEPYWQATLSNFNQALVMKLNPGDKISDPIFSQFSEFKHCRGTDWDRWYTGKKPYSANVEWRQLGLLLYRLVEAGKEHEMYDVFAQHVFVYRDTDDCNYECSAKEALAKATRLKGPLKDFVEWLILKHDTIKDESEVLTHAVFDSLEEGPAERAKKIELIKPSEQFVETFKTLTASDVYHPVGGEAATDFPLVTPGFPYFVLENTILTVEIFVDFTSPWSKRLYETIAHHVAPAYKQKVNFIFQSAPAAHHPQAGYLHEVALAVNDMAGPRRFWEFADLIFTKQDEFLDDAVYDMSRNAIHDKLIHMGGSIGIDNLMDLRKRVEGKNKWKVEQGMKFARKFLVERGSCLWTPIIALNGDWVAQAGSSWEQEDWRAFFDYHIALIEDPENAGVSVQARRPYDGFEGEGTHARSQQPLRPLGVHWPGRPSRIQLELFFDFSDEDSKRIFEMVHNQLAQMYEDKVTVIFQHVIDRGNHANVYMHEASFAVLDLGGPGKFFEFAGILFKEQDKFQDDVLANKSRHHVYQDLAVIAGRVFDMFSVLDRLQVVGKGNCGNRVTDHIMFADRYACSHGVYEAPRAFLNGVSVDVASAKWELEDWKVLLDKAIEALEHVDEG